MDFGLGPELARGSLAKLACHTNSNKSFQPPINGELIGIELCATSRVNRLFTGPFIHSFPQVLEP